VSSADLDARVDKNVRGDMGPRHRRRIRKTGLRTAGEVEDER